MKLPPRLHCILLAFSLLLLSCIEVQSQSEYPQRRLHKRQLSNTPQQQQQQRQIPPQTPALSTLPSNTQGGSTGQIPQGANGNFPPSSFPGQAGGLPQQGFPPQGLQQQQGAGMGGANGVGPWDSSFPTPQGQQQQGGGMGGVNGGVGPWDSSFPQDQQQRQQPQAGTFPSQNGFPSQQGQQQTGGSPSSPSSSSSSSGSFPPSQRFPSQGQQAWGGGNQQSSSQQGFPPQMNNAGIGAGVDDDIVLDSGDDSDYYDDEDTSDYSDDSQYDDSDSGGDEDFGSDDRTSTRPRVVNQKSSKAPPSSEKSKSKASSSSSSSLSTNTSAKDALPSIPKLLHTLSGLMGAFGPVLTTFAPIMGNTTVLGQLSEATGTFLPALAEYVDTCAGIFEKMTPPA